ncbi:hypothetical protein DM860_006482 [Cuscuta australis]|uniref:Expansin n=1 Tax=Cuscuta australis TaxID=267555 RepID=A0A328D3L9_9ASTE|nr:hypothetical protein DM860_006482 [Cuscuta australis]
MAYSGGHVGGRGVVASSAGGLIINNVFVINLAIIITTTISLVRTTNANYNNIYSDEWVSGAHATFYGQPGDKPDSMVTNAAANANSGSARRWVGGVHATFYGGPNDFDYMGGACGYGKKTKEWYGADGTTALSFAWFNEGRSCGQCFEIKCDYAAYPQWCIRGTSVTVTVTNSCPSGGWGWCNPPRKHFDMAMPAWLKIAKYRAGIVPVLYRRVRCKRHDGVRFTVNGINQYFSMLLISNVGGAGAVRAVSFKSGRDKVWRPMQRNWGQNWNMDPRFKGQALSFRVTTEDGHTKTFRNALPYGWAHGQDYHTSINDQFY